MHFHSRAGAFREVLLVFCAEDEETGPFFRVSTGLVWQSRSATATPSRDLNFPYYITTNGALHLVGWLGQVRAGRVARWGCWLDVDGWGARVRC